MMSELTTDACEVVNSEKTSQREELNKEVINEMNLNEILECRACLQKFSYNAGLIDLFQAWIAPWEGMGNTVAEDLAKLANIEISKADVFSKHICQLCYQKLQDACAFSTSVHKNDLVLRTTTNDFSKVWPKPIVVDNPILKSAMQVEIKQEPLSDNESDDLTECVGSDVNMQPDFTNLEIKVEPEEIIQLQPIKITVNGTITNDQFAQNSMSTNGDQFNESNFIEVTVKPELESDDEDSEVIPDLSLECMLCAKLFNSVSGLKAHVIAQHSYKTVKRKTEDEDSLLVEIGDKIKKYVCAICRRKFTTSTDLMVHETCHNKHSCYGCNEKFESFALLTAHREKCKAVLSKTTRKPKTLEDVKRPQMEVPQLAEVKIEAPDYTYSDSLHFMEESPDASNVKVHLKIKSINGAPEEATHTNDLEMKLETCDAYSEDDVMQ